MIDGMETTCPKCGGATAAGVAGAEGLLFAPARSADEPRLTFTVLGTPTSSNPVKAFAQGMADEPATRRFLVRGLRCSHCGFLELYAIDETA